MEQYSYFNWVKSLHNEADCKVVHRKLNAPFILNRGIFTTISLIPPFGKLQTHSKLLLGRFILLKNPPCIFCHLPRTDPPQTPCRYRSPCCSFWRCSGFWWWYDPRRERFPCRAWANWRFSWWRRSHLRRVPPKWDTQQETEELSGESKCICMCASGLF